MNTKPNIDELIAKAKAIRENDGRSKNKGRPRKPMEPEQAYIISAMRKKNCSIRKIFLVMKEEKLTKANTYGAFLSAWKQHRLYKSH